MRRERREKAGRNQEGDEIGRGAEEGPDRKHTAPARMCCDATSPVMHLAPQKATCHVVVPSISHSLHGLKNVISSAWARVQLRACTTPKRGGFRAGARGPEASWEDRSRGFV
jgi:hypothetical protein